MIRLFRLLAAGMLFGISACHKTGQTAASPPPSPGLSYGDSVFYLNATGADVTASPFGTYNGRFIGWPEGIVLDQNTGIIDVSKSETGLRYRISYIPSGSIDTLTTKVTIAGINFLDGFYVLAQGDSIANPVYNGSPGLNIPGLNSGTIFDEGGSCNNLGCDVNVVDGRINLAQTVRNGVFGSTPVNNDRHEFVLRYRIDDKSGKAANSLNVKLYYFDTMADVTQEVYDILSGRRGTIVTGTNPQSAKPRPPCLFIVAR